MNLTPEEFAFEVVSPVYLLDQRPIGKDEGSTACASQVIPDRISAAIATHSGDRAGATSTSPSAVFDGRNASPYRPAAAPLLCKLLFGEEPVLHIVTVFSPALLVQFVGAATDFIFNVGNGIFALH